MRAMILFASLLLAGCAKSPAELESIDDASCRKTITERNDARPTAYQECRQNMMAYRAQRNALRAATLSAPPSSMDVHIHRDD